MLKLALLCPEIERGERLEIVGDCPTFEHDIRMWCDRLGKTLLAVEAGEREVRMTIAF